MSTHQIHNERMLLVRIAEKDVEAFSLLYDAYKHKLYYIAYKMMHSETDAKDVVQEVFLKLWQNSSKLATIVHFSAYLNTLTRNHIYDQFRKKAHEDRYLQQLHLDGMQQPDALFDEIVYRQMLQKVQEAAQLLPPQQRRVFEMSRMKGLKHEMIAAALGISRETVKKHLIEALKAIRTTIAATASDTLLLCFILTYL